MNVLKSLSKFIWGNPDNPELIKITNGELYLVRPNSLKGNRECIFHTAQASVRRTGADWQYQIVIIDEEKVFLIDESLKFRKGQFEGLASFSWRDLSGDPDDLFEFVCDINITAHTVNTFEYTVYNCMFERKFQLSHDEATEEGIQSFIYEPGKKDDQIDKTPPSTPKNGRSISNSPYATPTSASTTPKRARNAENPSTPTKEAIILELPGVGSFKTVSIIDVEVELHVFDPRTATFLMQSPLATTSILRGNGYEYWLLVEDDNQRHVTQRIEPRMNPVFNSTHHCFIWVHFDGNNLIHSYLIKFLGSDHETSFKKRFTSAMYETLNETKAKEEEQDYLINAYQDEDVEMSDARDSDEEESGEETDSSEEDNDDINTEAEEGDGVNTQLTVGHKLDRSFVLKGNKIGVFKHIDDDKIEFSTNINNISTPKGKKFNPSKMMLHEGDSTMILMDENDEHNLYKMDLEYGKVVEEWNVHDIVPVANIFPKSKFAQMTGEKTLIGLSQNSIYSIDPRLPDYKLVDEKRRQYVTKNDFLSGATDAKGHIAVGTAKGDIKLFDSLGKIAKTNLPAMGSAIKGIDVTSDGKWLIATTDKYLLLINTEIKSDHEGRTGFEKSFAKTEKPKAKRLQLKPEHLALMEHDVNFTPARFNTGEYETEKTIITSTGPFVITWNFRQVKLGKLNDYHIKRYSDDVVADNFRFGQDKSIVVTLPHDVTLTRKKHLSTPTKSILTPSMEFYLLQNLKRCHEGGAISQADALRRNYLPEIYQQHIDDLKEVF
ncbi:17318_t:CDS:10 [Funneliformis geosporum]|uniref:17318_t:CDS:1 n=1 Tax=Funneliformis geosporum TaxID=1117311 RepID=A0A9W4WT21_9GLOM|nr:17318_t:CDS:10 [Funneliformis geosporum]